MELRHLRYFVAVAEQEHFGRAAKRLGVSQSPLSRQIAQLEEEVGVELFTPDGRGIRLTDAGTVFLEGARATLATADRSVADAREAAAGNAGTLTIGYENGSAYAGVLPNVMSEFRRRHPRVRLELIPLSSGEQWASIRHRKVAAGFCYYVPSDDPELRSRVLLRDRIAVLLPQGHRLADRKTVRVRDLKDENLLWFPRHENPQLYDDLMVALRKHGMSGPFTHERDGEATLTLVAAGLGITITVGSAASLLREGRVSAKRIVDIGVDVSSHMIWRADEEERPFLRALLDITKGLPVD